MSFSIIEASRTLKRPVNLYLFKGADPTLESMVRSMVMIPGTTQFGYGTTKVTTDDVPMNFLNGSELSDIEVSLNDLLSVAPDLVSVTLVVAWHGTDLRCGSCQIVPKVESATGADSPYAWTVGNVTRGNAQVVSQISGKPAIGGAPSDRSIFEAIAAIKARGLKVTLYPFIIMDIPSGNSLTDPYGGVRQAAYPWRGRITCNPAPGRPSTVDGTSGAQTQVNSFFGVAASNQFSWDATNKKVNYSGPVEWGLRRFVLHMATIAKAAGGVDDFLVGSELVGLTRVRASSNTYPAVAALASLVTSTKSYLPGTRVSYAADWSEYHSHQPAGGGLVFNMDQLWAACDFVAIDNYLPLTDWRNSGSNIDSEIAFSPYDETYLRDNIEGGEYYDWYYASSNARTNQTRTPIDHWRWRQKDIRSWWKNNHYNVSAAGVVSTTATSWTAQGKPVVFTELGCPAVNLGANQPNVFVDAKSSESAVPYFSNGNQDPAMQRAYIEAWLSYWRVYNEPGFIEYDSIGLWAWDARPYPTFPSRSDFWGDSDNWLKGHWLTGRLVPGRAIESSFSQFFAFTNAEKPVMRDGITFQPWPVEHGDFSQDGTLDKSGLDVTLAVGTGIDAMFSAGAPSGVLNLIIYKGHHGLGSDAKNWPVEWSGQVAGVSFKNNNRLTVSAQSIATSMSRPGLRRNYQLHCPHALYGESCRASLRNASALVTISGATSTYVTLSSAPPVARGKYAGGLLFWTDANGTRQVRTILSISATNRVNVRGIISGLSSGDEVTIALGCNRKMNDCRDLHGNILNFGGQPFIPLQSPVSSTSIFY